MSASASRRLDCVGMPTPLALRTYKNWFRLAVLYNSPRITPNWFLLVHCMSFGVELLQGSPSNTLFFMCEIQVLEVMLGSAMCHPHAPPGNVVLFMLVIQGLEVMLGLAVATLMLPLASLFLCVSIRVHFVCMHSVCQALVDFVSRNRSFPEWGSCSEAPPGHVMCALAGPVHNGEGVAHPP